MKTPVFTIELFIGLIVSGFLLSGQLMAMDGHKGYLQQNLGLQPAQYSLSASNPESGWEPTTSVYLELGGKFFPSLNIDFRKNEKYAFSLGAGYWHDEEEHVQDLFIPSIMGFYFAGQRSRLEIGGGLGPFIGTYMGFASVLLFGDIGYRYQKKDGLIFRVSFTPFLGIPTKKDSRFWISPWAGISLGYSF